MEKKELKEKILEAMVFNSPESSAEAILDIVQQEIDRAREEGKMEGYLLWPKQANEWKCPTGHQGTEGVSKLKDKKE